MYHAIGERFSGVSDVRQKIVSLHSRWNKSISPALVELAKTEKPPPKVDDSNGTCSLNLCLITDLLFIGIMMYCLIFLAEKLRPRKGKSSAQSTVDAVICFASVCHFNVEW